MKVNRVEAIDKIQKAIAEGLESGAFSSFSMRSFLANIKRKTPDLHSIRSRKI